MGADTPGGKTSGDRASYAPIMRMQQKAALLRAELQSPSPDPADTSSSKAGVRARVGSLDDSQYPSTPSKNKASLSGLSKAAPWTEAGNLDTQPSSPTGSIISRRSLSPKKSMAGNSLRGNSVHRGSYEAQAAMGHRINVLEQQLADLQAQHTQACSEMDARQESYMRREDELKAQVADLQAALQVARGEQSNTQEAKFGTATNTIMDLHGKVVAEIEALLSRQEVTIKHEEQTQTRRLKNQLAQIEAELGAERGAQGRSDAEWLARTQSLRLELDTVQEVANKLDAMYKLSDEECKRLRAQFKCQEDDREVLVRQVVGLKKENKRLAVELAAMAVEAAAVAQERDQAVEAAQGTTSGGQPSAAAFPASNLSKATVQVKIQRYEDVIESLKKVCEAERKRTRQARAAHLQELTARTELHMVLRQLVEDVRKEHTQLAASLTAAPSDQETDPPAGLSMMTPGPTATVFRRSESASFVRPHSAMPVSHSGRASLGRPQTHLNRPLSAVHSLHSQRPGSAVRQQPAVTPRSSGLDPPARAALMANLMQQEKLLVRLLDAGFPNVSPPSLPANTGQLDRIAQVQDAREGAVVAQARMLGAVGRTGARDAAPGNELASKPWVLNVDAMMTEFLTS